MVGSGTWTGEHLCVRPSGFRPECLEHSEIDLAPVQVAQRWGTVWINMDPDAPSLEESLGGIKDYIDPLRMDLMRVRWWKQIRLESNWKVAQEAFFEAYHVMQAHPELTLFTEGEKVNMTRGTTPRRWCPSTAWVTGPTFTAGTPTGPHKPCRKARPLASR